MNKKVLLIVGVFLLVGAIVVSAAGAGLYLWLSDDDEVKIPETTKLLDESTLQYLASVSDDGSTLTFDQETEQLESLSEGDIIVCEVSDETPYGLLRKVTDISEDNGEVIVETEAATLEDAIEKADIEVSWSLPSGEDASSTALGGGGDAVVEATPASLAHGVVISTTPRNGIIPAADDESEPVFSEEIEAVLYENDAGDQIKVEGSLTLDADFSFGAKISGSKLKQLNLTIAVDETAALVLSGEVSRDFEPDPVEVFSKNLPTITVWAGWLPIIITPQLTIDVGCSGEIAIGMEASVTQTASASVGLQYDEGDWSTEEDLTGPDFSHETPEIDTTCTAKAFVRPKLNFMLYGIAGPYGEVEGYLELEADPLNQGTSTPWWELSGGIEGNVGINMEVLADEEDSPSYTLIEKSVSLAQASVDEDQEDGEIAGNVKDAVTDDPLEGVTVNVYDGDDLVATETTDSDGNYVVSIPPGSGYEVEFSRTGYFTAYYSNIEVTEIVRSYLEAVLVVDESYSGTGNVSGTIKNALDGTGVSGLTIALREGINVTSGSTVETTTTGIDGSYSFSSLDVGHYTAEVSGTGYNTAHFTILCIGGVSSPGQDATVTPVMAGGETRIILTWGETPYDLDSHLTGPLSGGGRFHIYYLYKTAGTTGTDNVELDLDDVYSYGPETTTIYNQIDGVYRYSVHDYSNAYSGSSTALSSSQAQVRVYQGSDLVANFNVPTGQGGTLWTVFELDGDTISPINTMSYETLPDDVT